MTANIKNWIHLVTFFENCTIRYAISQNPYIESLVSIAKVLSNLFPKTLFQNEGYGGHLENQTDFKVHIAHLD